MYASWVVRSQETALPGNSGVIPLYYMQNVAEVGLAAHSETNSQSLLDYFGRVLLIGQFSGKVRRSTAGLDVLDSELAWGAVCKKGYWLTSEDGSSHFWLT